MLRSTTARYSGLCRTQSACSRSKRLVSGSNRSRSESSARPQLACGIAAGFDHSIHSAFTRVYSASGLYGTAIKQSKCLSVSCSAGETRSGVDCSIWLDGLILSAFVSLSLNYDDIVRRELLGPSAHSRVHAARELYVTASAQGKCLSVSSWPQQGAQHPFTGRLSTIVNLPAAWRQVSTSENHQAAHSSENRQAREQHAREIR